MKKCTKCNREFEPSSRHKKCPRCRSYERSKICPDCNGPMRPQSGKCKDCVDRRGDNNGNWRGGGTKHQKGYIMRTVEGRGYVFEHILVMEEGIERSLVPGETVHHKNGIRDDNRLENLELWTKPQPPGIRAKDALQWAREVLSLYEPIESKGLL